MASAVARVAFLPPCFCLLLGVWLIIVHSEQVGSYSASGENSGCRRSLVSDSSPGTGHITVDKWVLGQGILNVLTLVVLACAVVAVKAGGEEGPGVVIMGCTCLAHVGIWIWGQVEVWAAEEKDCGEMLYQGRIFIILTYCWIGALLLAVCLHCGNDRDEECATLSAAGLWWCLMLGMWIGVFVGVNMPEVRKMTTWKEARCVVSELVGTSDAAAHPAEATQARVPCCSALCSGCSDSSGLRSCGSMTSGPGAQPGGANDGADCENGYHCCSQCCSTCCSSSCGKSGCSSTCHSCNCYCCDWVNERRCHVECQWCYRPSYKVEVRDAVDDALISHGVKSKECDVCKRHGCEQDNIQQMESFLKVNGRGVELGFADRCWYDPDHVQDFDWNISYTGSRWVLLAIPSIFLLLTPFAACGCRCCSLRALGSCCGECATFVIGGAQALLRRPQRGNAGVRNDDIRERLNVRRSSVLEQPSGGGGGAPPPPGPPSAADHSEIPQVIKPSASGSLVNPYATATAVPGPPGQTGSNEPCEPELEL
eukprot:TRINITY_DN8131_c2_g1_i1.p1 TRINITY_DN8131_c2_g1~~TRINITY_DN8131_c2_g1_i1.p1  ORF type:complete len:564 (+),score=173.28 TRINITY_DN8131_c2_g1_i1:81-1694(+)